MFDRSLISDIKLNNTNAIARSITMLENGEDIPDSFFSDIYQSTSKAIRIGITGPPGAGKSTLSNEIVGQCLANKESVGVIAIDPTSPFTGGALLGDRVRMNKYGSDDRVFIRSMGSRGSLGGIAKKTQDVADILDASGKDIIIFETVGVGQGEYDVAKAADITVVVLVPESGDEIQLMKAGLIEIADLFVINKSDREGSNRIASTLKNVLHHFSNDKPKEPEVLKTIASEGRGITELYLAIKDELNFMQKNGLLLERRLDRYKGRVLDIIKESLEKEFWTSDRRKLLDTRARSLKSLSSAPIDTAKSLLKSQ
ncbi:MAG: methylmalonyl Co-A mutase-associated GTPase MeaB [Candidatus Marinimicrobia bacterium]|nr:methylmalonyl Co-A mutase-associated GTPase MeaB [Candidatus Neomarinimicrobiota bacterium]|tara:strand:- start:1957 stop:2895 length:939 start_codon:yes stop_codon:yes gene_type:complete